MAPARGADPPDDVPGGDPGHAGALPIPHKPAWPGRSSYAPQQNNRVDPRELTNRGIEACIKMSFRLAFCGKSIGRIHRYGRGAATPEPGRDPAQELNWRPLRPELSAQANKAASVGCSRRWQELMWLRSPRLTALGGVSSPLCTPRPVSRQLCPSGSVSGHPGG